MKQFLLFFIFFTGTLLAGTVHIMNDTSFPLNAEVFSADGQSRGKILIAPHANSTWQDTSSVNYKWSQTPYRVIFTCANSGKQYGVIDGVQQSAYIRASMASGPRDCSEDKKKDTPNNVAPQENVEPQNTEPPGDPNWGPP